MWRLSGQVRLARVGRSLNATVPSMRALVRAANSDLVRVRGAERDLRCRSFRNWVNCSGLWGVVDDVGFTFCLTEAWGRRWRCLTSRVSRSDSILILTCGIRQKWSHHRSYRTNSRYKDPYAS